MKIRTVVVSRYPIFRAGLGKILGSNFVIDSHYADVRELLAGGAEVELVVLDEKASKDLDILRKERPDLTILKLSIESNSGYLYEGINGAIDAIELDAISRLAKRVLATRYEKRY